MTLFTLQLPDPCPERVTRKAGAEALTLAGFETTAKSIAGWGLQSFPVNGKQTVNTRDLFAEAQRRIEDEHERLLNSRGRTAARGLRSAS